MASTYINIPNLVTGPNTSTVGNLATFGVTNGSVLTDSGILASGIVSGPASATDNAICRFDLTTGKLIQNSSVLIDDNGRMSVAGTAFAATSQLHVKSYNAAVVAMILDTQVGHAADLVQYKIGGTTKGVWTSAGKFVVGGTASISDAVCTFISDSSAYQPIAIQNTAASGYSQVYMYDNSSAIVGAFGYANASAAVSASKLFMSTVAKDFYISTDASTTRHFLLSATSGRALFTNSVIAGTVGVSAQITGSGSAGGVLAAGKFSLLAGYTGASGSFGVYAQNQTAGTATDEFSNAQSANYGEYIATTVGTVIGQAGYASGGNKSYGGFFRAIIDKASATNVGVGGFASISTGTAAVGGFFGLMNTAPTYTSAALICDNGVTTSPILLARDNGSTIMSVADGGVTVHSTTATSGGLDAFTITQGAHTAVTAQKKIFALSASTLSLNTAAALTAQTFSDFGQHTVTGGVGSSITNCYGVSSAVPTISGTNTTLTNVSAYNAGGAVFGFSILNAAGSTASFYNVSDTTVTLATTTQMTAVPSITAFKAGVLTLTGSAGAVTVARVSAFWGSAMSVSTNVTVTNSSVFAGGADVNLGPSSDGMSYAVYNGPAHTVTVTGGVGVTSAAGFSVAHMHRLTVTSASATTVTNASSLYIANSPLAAGSVTLTNTYAIFSDAGINRFDGDGTYVFELPADATDPTAGGGAAAGRIAVKIGGATKYLAYY